MTWRCNTACGESLGLLPRIRVICLFRPAEVRASSSMFFDDLACPIWKGKLRKWGQNFEGASKSGHFRRVDSMHK